MSTTSIDLPTVVADEDEKTILHNRMRDVQLKNESGEPLGKLMSVRMDITVDQLQRICNALLVQVRYHYTLC